MLNLRTQFLLEERHVPHQVLAHDRAFTAHGTAAAAHVSGGRFAKVLVVQARPGHPVMVVLPASCHADMEAVADVIGEGPVSLVQELELQRLFPDCEVGAMPPFGSLYGMPVVMDECLIHGSDVFCNAGNHRETVGLRMSDLIALARPTVAAICHRH